MKVVERRVAQQPIEVEALVRRMAEAVRDPNLKLGFCRKVAWAVVEGLYPPHRLERILSSSAALATPKDRGRYFVAACRKSFSDSGVPLERSK